MALSLVRQPIFGGDGDSPEARTGSCVAVVDQRMYVWGGHTQRLVEEAPVEELLPSTEDSFIDVYDLQRNAWQQFPTTGDVPDLGNGSTFTAFSHQIFLFGGWNEGDFSNDLYCFDTHSNSWKLIAVAESATKPSPRYLTGVVLVHDVESNSDKLCVFGGVGLPITKVQEGAQYVAYRSHARDFGFGWNNEMFFFDINKSKYISYYISFLYMIIFVPVFFTQRHGLIWRL